MWQKREVSEDKLEGKRPLGRIRHTWEDKIKIEFKKTGHVGV